MHGKVYWIYTGTLADNLKVLRDLPPDAEFPDDVVIAAGLYDFLFCARDKTCAGAAAQRAAAAADLATLFALDQRFSSTRLWYRTAHCNRKFPAAEADRVILSEARRWGAPLFGIMDAFNFSRGDAAAQTNSGDSFHYDLHPWNPPKHYDSNPFAGMLQAQVVQGMLFRLCTDGHAAAPQPQEQPAAPPVSWWVAAPPLATAAPPLPPLPPAPA